MSVHLLVGDVGGTSCRFAWVERSVEGGVALSAFTKYRNDEFDSLAGAIGRFLDTGTGGPVHALFALAGPVQNDGGIQLTNRDWPYVRPDELRRSCGLQHVELVNDFAAMARAIPEMPRSAYVTVRDGLSVAEAPVMVTGPGTGFGVATLIPARGGGWRVLTGEGGHAAYAAHTVREAELAERLYAEHGYVSTEMVVSGAWLQPVHDHLSDMHGHARAALSAEEILARADDGDPVCAEVCRLRARAIMGAIGDYVLINGAQGGVVLTGGVAERMVTWLQSDEAIARFETRGSHSGFMQDVSVRVLTEPSAPLVGAGALLLEHEG